jgi:hypothetical protein
MKVHRERAQARLLAGLIGALAALVIFFLLPGAGSLPFFSTLPAGGDSTGVLSISPRAPSGPGGTLPPQGHKRSNAPSPTNPTSTGGGSSPGGTSSGAGGTGPPTVLVAIHHNGPDRHSEPNHKAKNSNDQKPKPGQTPDTTKNGHKSPKDPTTPALKTEKGHRKADKAPKDQNAPKPGKDPKGHGGSDPKPHHGPAHEPNKPSARGHGHHAKAHHVKPEHAKPDHRPPHPPHPHGAAGSHPHHGHPSGGHAGKSHRRHKH